MSEWAAANGRMAASWETRGPPEMPSPMAGVDLLLHGCCDCMYLALGLDMYLTLGFDTCSFDGGVNE